LSDSLERLPLLTAAIERFFASPAASPPVAQPLWVAYSGGEDSTALLMACKALGLAFRAIHVNHQLQTVANEMAQHCIAFCHAADIELQVLTVEVKRAGGESLEAQARSSRYQAIARCMQENGGGLLLTAHHQEDQIETALIALFRGSGLEGLAGMAPVSPLPSSGSGLMLGRPLLTVQKQDIRVCVQQNGWTFFEDPSNASDAFRRNWLRHQLLPQVEAQFPQVRSSLLRLSRQVSAYKTEVRASSESLLAAVAAPEGYLRHAEFQLLNEGNKARLLRLWLSKSGIRINELKTLELIRQLESTKGGLRTVGGRWAVRVKRGQLTLEMDLNTVTNKDSESDA
jgi:tRNA(Ile)-lysidine synthase